MVPIRASLAKPQELRAFVSDRVAVTGGIVKIELIEYVNVGDYVDNTILVTYLNGDTDTFIVKSRNGTIPEYLLTELRDSINANAQAIAEESQRAQKAEGELGDKVLAIENKIPSQASETNKLADVNFVNSSIATNTAHYISKDGQPFTSKEELDAYSGPVTLNDYAFIKVIDEMTGLVDRYDRYKFDGIEWAFEYTLNNSSFTAAQWSALNSGVTEDLLKGLKEGIEDVEDAVEGVAAIAAQKVPMPTDTASVVRLAVFSAGTNEVSYMDATELGSKQYVVFMED